MSAKVKSDIEIARAAKKRPILEIGAKARHSGGEPRALRPRQGEGLGRVHHARSPARPDGKLILVTAINPTPAGEGKTTTTVGLGDALNRIGKRAAICLREPSLGPCFGMKGGAAGGGYAQVVPMEDINLHFTGDFHAITAAHNLLSAMIDNHLYWGNALDLDSRRIVWRRVMDMNDRALREIVCSLGGVANGFPREAGFDITVASEIMAILCLANDIDDLQKRIGDIVIGYRRDKSAVTARDLKADGAMTVLLMKAMQPNLVQTLENNPAFIHGGPFANIAHGCNSVMATKTALKLADYVVTEAGFGADLGAEKFFDIKCRAAGLKPSAAVIVATVRALKMHGGVAKDALGKANVEALKKGCANLGRHIDNVKQFGVPVVVAINNFTSDTKEEIAAVQEFAAVARRGGDPLRALGEGLGGHRGAGACGGEARRIRRGAVRAALRFRPAALRKDHADRDAHLPRRGGGRRQEDPRPAARMGQGRATASLPVCMAKTQYSFSTDPNLRGAPTHHVVPIREVRLSAGAGFVVVICGEIMTMPGLPKVPAAETMGWTRMGWWRGCSEVRLPSYSFPVLTRVLAWGASEVTSPIRTDGWSGSIRRIRPMNWSRPTTRGPLPTTPTCSRSATPILLWRWGWCARHVPAMTHASSMPASGREFSASLSILGYRNLAGIDMSEGMLAKARKRKVYSELRNRVLGKSLDFDDGAFAAVVTFGVFTPGHAPAVAFDELVRITRPGGHLIFTVSTAAEKLETPPREASIPGAGGAHSRRGIDRRVSAHAAVTNRVDISPDARFRLHRIDPSFA